MNTLPLIQFLIEEFHLKLNSVQNLIQRKVSFHQVSNKIKVAIGMRRTGKTSLMFQTIQQLLNNGVVIEQILYINFEDDRLLPLTREKLAELLDGFYSFYPNNHERKCYLFLDEIQNVQDWALVIRRYFDSKLVEIYLTGSSAKLLSKEIATALRGRSLSTEVWPYDFDEYLLSKNIIMDKAIFGAKTRDQCLYYFQEYLAVGGFPEIVTYNDAIREQTLQEYVTVVTFRDIIERYSNVNQTIIKYLILAMLKNIGNPFSINKFYNDLKSQGFKTTKDSLYQYTDYIEDAFLAFSVPLYAESIRKIQINPKKIYAIDAGLVRAMTLEYHKDCGRLFENLIYLDLRRHGYQVSYYLTKERYEVDFLAQSSKGEIGLIQVVWDLQNEQTRLREERALEKAMHELRVPGKIITLEQYLKEGLLCVAL